MPAGLPHMNERTWVQPEPNTVTVRVPRDVWDALHAPARENGRSQTAECVARLRSSLEPVVVDDSPKGKKR